MLLNPAFMYAAIWLLVLGAYLLDLSDLLQPLETSTIILVIGSSLAFILGWVLESLLMHGVLANSKFNLGLLGRLISSARIGQRLKQLWFIFGLGIFFEIVYFRGAPLLSLIGIGSEILYVEFGIPVLHGLLNSIFYSCSVVQFARTLLDTSKRSILLTLLSLCYPLLGMSRQVFISLLLQYLLIYFSLRRPTSMALVRVGFVFMAMILIFGYLGDIRSGREHIISLAEPTFEYPDWLPSAFIWVYIYLCTPLNNVNYNINITPNYLPFETAGTFVPSILREFFLNSIGSTRQWDLVTDSFNVSSLLQSLLTDFGVSGSIVFSLFCSIGFSSVLRCSVSSPSSYFALIVLLHGIALSFFANLLFHLVFVFEIFVITQIVAEKGKR